MNEDQLNHHLTSWQENGYLLLRQALDLDRVARLRQVSDAALEKWQRESRKEVEPNEYAHGPFAWMMLHLNHPKHHGAIDGSLPHLLGAIADPSMLSVVRKLLRDQPLMMQANYYINPSAANKLGGWHRDCQFFDAGSEDAERRQFELEIDPPRELHMHIPLVTTEATHVVPGSHKRWDTPEENRIRRKDSHSDAMPGALKLRMEPGDVGFFHVNALHRGNYAPEIPRRTIAVSWSSAKNRRPITREWLTRWKGYAAPCQPWFLRPGYLDGLSRETREFYQSQIDTLRSEWEQPGLFDDLSPERRSYFFEV